MNLFIPLIVFSIWCVSALAQDINFDDLRRPGKPLSKSYTVKGAGAEGASAIMKFGDIDTRRVERTKSSGSGGSGCFSIRNEDKRYLCLAQTKRERSTCFSVRSEGMRFECLASFDGRSNCFSIRNEDERWGCLAQFDGRSNCFSIRNEDGRSACLAQFDGKSNCYSIRNEDDRWLCLATTN